MKSLTYVTLHNKALAVCTSSCFSLVKALERVQKLCYGDKIFILAINSLSSACSLLITATFYVMGIDLNTLKTSHDLLISIAVIVKTYNSCSKSIRESFTCDMWLFHMQASQPITAVGGYTESHSRHAPSKPQPRKNAFNF